MVQDNLCMQNTANGHSKDADIVTNYQLDIKWCNNLATILEGFHLVT